MIVLQNSIKRYTNGAIQDLEYLKIVPHHFSLHTLWHNYIFLDYKI